MDVREEHKIEESFYDQTFVSFKRGDVIKGKVVQIEPTAVFVDIGGKTEGIIPLDELSAKPVADPRSVVNVGDEIEVCVVKMEDEDGTLRLSRKRAELEKTWIRIKEARQKGQILQGTVVEQVKGGLVVDLGVRGFIPASHVGKRFVKNLDEFIGESLSLKVLEMDPQRGRVILSHKLAAEEEAKQSKSAFWDDVYEGQLRSGTVMRFANFGAFVDLGGVDGLIHLSELSWRRAKHPSEVLKIGEKVEVMVLGFDREKERISLSLRRAQPDPWTQLPQTLQVGALVDGTVTKIAKRYVFVEVMPGVEGLIPLTELADKKLPNPADVVKEGEKVTVRLIDIKPDQRRMLLSLRQALEPRPAPVNEDDYRHYLKTQEDRPLTLKDILGDQLPTEMGGPGK